MNTSAPVVEFRGIPPLSGLTTQVTARVAGLVDDLDDHPTCHVLIHRPSWSVVPPFYIEARVEIASGGRPRVVVSEARRLPACTEDVMVRVLQPTVTRLFDVVATYLTAPSFQSRPASPPQPAPS